ncbi:hypothetical protein BV20DRAFT_250722 [Pilatotrama ljubarskyi]|nr:hypothetical protein BV20DRAFT_250722 [Pilatotrama ljubarskyi]
MSAHNSTSSVSSDTTKVPSVQYETSNGPSSATTSSPATSAPSRASTTAPLPPPPPPPPMNVGYFIPPPWVQPYPPPYSYPVPVVAGYAHPGYAYPHIPAMQSAVLAQAATAPTAMSGSRGSLAPASVEPTNKLSSAGEGETQSSPQSVMQPPLRATGFIQNEQGTLIPVYQREALDQYMANAHNAEPLPQSTSVPGQGPPSAATNLTLWPTPPFPVYAGTYPVAANSVHHPCFPHPPQQGPWLPGGPAYGMAPFPPADPRAFSRPFSAAGIAPRPMRGPPQVAQVPNQPPYGRPGGYSPSLRRYNKRDDQLRGGGRPTASG